MAVGAVEVAVLVPHTLVSLHAVLVVEEAGVVTTEDDVELVFPVDVEVAVVTATVVVAPTLHG